MEERTTQILGLRVRYLTGGPAETDRPPILFLHGWGAPAETYRVLLDYLSTDSAPDRGDAFRVFAPDLPGFGGSEEPPAPWSVDDYADWAAALAKELGLDRAILMNHSFGGRISIKLLSRRPAPFSVGQAVFMDAAGIRPHRTLGHRLKVGSYKVMKRVLSLPPVRRMFPDALERLRKQRGSADYRQASPVMRQTMVRCIEDDLTALLPRIDASVLLIWGEADTATPLADGKTMERLIPDAGLVTLPGAGHFAFAERWGQCSRVLDVFLRPDAG